jgi:TPP-dependent indolepyruvate ferredoxin oxidoreductase alpha subunit
MSVQPRLIQTDGHAVLSGAQMLVKGGLESGVDTLIGAMLDGPTPYTDLLHDHAALLQSKGVKTLAQPDARQAVAALHSAWLNGRRALGLIDAIGVIDASAVLLAASTPTDADPGAVVMGFGPCDSPQGMAALALLRRAGWVVVEPALQDEVKSFTQSALRLSAVSGRPVALSLPADLYHGAATVACGPNQYPASGEPTPTERASENVDPLSAVLAEAHASHINAVVNPPGKDEALPLALVAVGRSFGWARQAMAELGLVGRVPILRLGVLSPLDAGKIQRHASGSRRVLVLDPTGVGVGDAACAIASPDRHTPPDEGPFPEEGEGRGRPKRRALPVALGAQAGPAGVVRVLRPWLESHPTLPRELVQAGLSRLSAVAGHNPDETGAVDQLKDGDVAASIPRRGTNPPPGSSLVDLSVVLGQLRRDLADAQHMLEQHRAGPITVSVFGELDDAARRLLTRWLPLDGGLDCDGRLAGAAAAGAIGQDTQRSVVLMTSRRFFSLGTSAIADAVRAGRNAVFVVHTEDPAEALGPRRRWQRRPKVNALDMQAIVEGIGLGRRNPTPSVTTIDPSDRPRLRRLLERLLLSDGVHVVIARRRRGPRYYRKASEVHQKQSARRGYVAKQGCLAHCPEAGPLTPRRRIELGVLGVEPAEPGEDDWTVSVSWSWHDETVMHAIAEPAVGLAILERNQPERSRVVAEDLDDLPPPARPIHAGADAWRATLVGITGSAYDLTLELMLEAGAAMGYLVRCTRAAQAPDGPAARRADLLFTRREVADAPHVPAAPGRSSAPMLTAAPMPGHTDLLLATELSEAARQLAADPRPEPITAGKHALIDTLLIPDIDALSTGVMPDRDALIRSLPPAGQDAGGVALPIAQLAEWFWGHQRYAAWVYLGYLVQRGLVPLTTTAIDAAGVRVLGVTDPRSAEAVKVGRKLAVDPGYADRALSPDSPTPEALLKTLADDLAEQAGSRRGASLAGAFQAQAQPLIDEAAGLDDATRRQIVVAAQRCAMWGGAKHGPAYCERFAKALRHVLSIDAPEHGHVLTRAAIDGLSRAMLIPDEVYLAALLTAPARYRRDRRRLNISLERGDRISYVHLLRPEFDLFKRRVGFTVTLGDRALKTIAGLHVLRRIRPGWYRAQRAFRDRYVDALTDLPSPKSESAYRHAREVIDSAAVILGRGEVRRESVAKAKRVLEKLLSSGDKA